MININAKPKIRDSTHITYDAICRYVCALSYRDSCELIGATLKQPVEVIQTLYSKASTMFVSYNTSTNYSKWLWICNQISEGEKN